MGKGQEDESWGIALACIHGQPKRLDAPLVHLWHPPPERLSRKVGSLESRRLRKRYGLARQNPERMRALINECR